jgi:hypothetical protein
MHDYVFTQPPDKPLFPDLIWSRPENKLHAGKLLIVGGNAQGFSSIGEAYNITNKAGAGTIRIAMPDVLRKTVSNFFPEASFLPSTPSGSLAKTALSELLSEAAWSDGVLIAGDLGRNSETAILLQEFLAKFSGQVTITRDAADYFTKLSRPVIERNNTTLVISLAQLQKIYSSIDATTPVTFSMDLIRLADALHDLTSKSDINIVTRHQNNIFVASYGKISLTRVNSSEKIWRLNTASKSCVWWMQNTSKTFEALTTSIIQ